MSEERSCLTCGWEHDEECEHGIGCSDFDVAEYWKPKTPRFQMADAEVATDKSVESTAVDKRVSDGSTASYYELPEGATELQHLISFKNMNAQIGEIFRACYRYGQAAHSAKIRDAKKIKFYIEAEIKRLEKYT